jgi:16S rRNA (guanine966-N2)-methyltransferase
MTRIVAGAARGRRLATPPGRGPRPTSDRAREGMFSTLQTVLGDVDGARVLDLYAGSGAVGLEALSRGASHVLLVESDRRAAAVVAANVEQVGLPGAVVRAAAVEHVVASSVPEKPYDLAFLDPPYAVTDDEVRVVLGVLLERGWLVPGSVLVVERATRGGSFVWPPGFEGDRERRYGEGTLWYGRAAGDERE